MAGTNLAVGKSGGHKNSQIGSGMISPHGGAHHNKSHQD
jgi:hypothetical protein